MPGIGPISAAVTDLGLGTSLSEQVKQETDDERRKRLLAQKGAQLSPGAASLLGPGMGMTGGGY